MRRFGAEVAVEAQEIEFEAVEVVVLTELADQRELLRTHLGHREVMHEVRTALRAGLDAMLGMLRVKLRHAHADAAARFVAGLRIDELLVMRVVHAQRDERRLSLGAAAVDEDLHHIAAIQHELAEGVRLLRVALFDPRIVFRQRQHLARPHRHHAKSRLEKMGVHQTSRPHRPMLRASLCEGLTRL
jgi:hypothetical protein